MRYCSISCVVMLVLATAASAAGTFSLAGTHPDASTETTGVAKVLRSITPYNGKLFIAYGDWYENAGPCNIRYFDTASDTFSPNQLTFMTDTITHYRVNGDVVYAPAIDRKSTPNIMMASSGPGGTNWTQRLDSSQPNSTHLFDVNFYNGQIVAVGSWGTNAWAWKSSDGGATWSNFTDVRGTDADFNRFYFAAVYNGKLYLQAQTAQYNTYYSNSRVYDGTSWSNGPDMLLAGTADGYRPQVFKDSLVYMSSEDAPLSGYGWLLKFDGQTASKVSIPRAIGDRSMNQFFDYFIYRDKLFVLGMNRQIFATSNLLDWELICNAPSTASCLGVSNGELYVGTTDSKLYLYSELVPEPLTMSLLSLALPLLLRRRGKVIAAA